jgi:phosphotransferase system  glucose/maltose/N-acetylglucosamine-specific IIC component
MYREYYKIKNQTIGKMSTIFTVPVVIVSLQSIVIGVATLLTVGLFLTVLKATSCEVPSGVR